MKISCKVIALVMLSLSSCVMAQSRAVSVSVRSLGLARNERIVGFEIHIHSGRVALVPNVPIGWSISIDNDPSWNTAIKGSVEVGAAALSPEFLRDVLVVEVEKDAPMPLKLDGDIVVTSDFLKERKIYLTMKDFFISEPQVAK